ncbi:capsid protein VP2 [Nanoarchaeota archaeon]|nr:MAG: capsid protein VP2 [Nanoarchaeota archaeon]
MGRRSSGRWIQRAIKRPGRVKRLLRRWYGSKAFTRSGEIRHSYLYKAKRRVKREMPPGKRRRSLLSAINLAIRLEKFSKRKKRRR